MVSMPLKNPGVFSFISFCKKQRERAQALANFGSLKGCGLKRPWWSLENVEARAFGLRSAVPREVA